MATPGVPGEAAAASGHGAGATGERHAGRLHLCGMLVLVSALGFLSMGFQLVGSRLLAPFFGSTIIVWAFLISTFLAAYSLGAFLGGGLSRLRPCAWRAPLTGVLAGLSCGLAFVAYAGKPCLAWIEAGIPDFNVAIAVSCLLLFTLPVAAMSAILPFCAQHLGLSGCQSGYATGLIYGTNTLGNIAGTLTTALVLIPAYGVAALLRAWFAGGVLTMFLLTRHMLRHECRPT